MCVCEGVYVRVCVRVCERVCVRVCVRVYVRVCDETGCVCRVMKV